MSGGLVALLENPQELDELRADARLLDSLVSEINTLERRFGTNVNALLKGGRLHDRPDFVCRRRWLDRQTRRLTLHRHCKRGIHDFTVRPDYRRSYWHWPRGRRSALWPAI
jgi:hypothetical protein